nr:hypothetical protein [Bacteroidia bacterium]
LVNVTLYLDNQNEQKTIESEMIFQCFKDAAVFHLFDKLQIDEQNNIINDINSAATENQKVERIVKFISKLEESN